MPFVRQLGLLGLSLFTLTSVAKTSCEELNDLWRARFYKDFNVEWKADSFQCPSADATMAKAIYDVYKPNLGFDFYSWASGLVKKMYYTSSCQKGVVATMRSDGVMKICPAFYTDQEVSRAGTIVHEATHAEKGDEGHVECLRGSSKGSRACDRKLNESGGGSGYNREFIYLAALYTRSDYQGLDRELIRYTLKFMVGNRFNQVTSQQLSKWSNLSRTPLPSTDEVIALDENKAQEEIREGLLKGEYDVKKVLESVRRIFEEGEKRLELAKAVLNASGGNSLSLSMLKNEVLEQLLEQRIEDLSLIDTVSKLASEEKDLSVVRSALQWLKRTNEKDFVQAKAARSNEEQPLLSDI